MYLVQTRMQQMKRKHQAVVLIQAWWRYQTHFGTGPIMWTKGGVLVKLRDSESTNVQQFAEQMGATVIASSCPATKSSPAHSHELRIFIQTHLDAISSGNNLSEMEILADLCRHRQVVQTVQSNHEVEEFHVKLAGSSFAARSSGRTYKRESLQKMVSYVRRFRRHRRIKVLENPGLECQSVELQSTVLRLKQKQHVALVQIEVVKTIFEHQTCFLNNLNTLMAKAEHRLEQNSFALGRIVTKTTNIPASQPTSEPPPTSSEAVKEHNTASSSLAPRLTKGICNQSNYTVADMPPRQRHKDLCISDLDVALL
mmetsp:Transcript_85185/g.124653  ORF Transcript_85185/g.124653 Transcript_85185/m.124653 type:complete len:312 (-) Transcript_85185:713-1648(-)